MENGLFVRLIDGDLNVAPGTKVIPAQDYLNYQRSTDLILNAKIRANTILKDLSKQCTEERIRAREEGRAIAAKEAFEVFVDMSQRAVEYLQQLEPLLVQVVIAAVEKILGSTSEEDKVRSIVSQMINKMQSGGSMTLRLGSETGELVDTLKQLPNLHCRVDPTLSPDALILESPLGTVDGSLSAQLETLRQALYKRFSNSDQNDNGITFDNTP